MEALANVTEICGHYEYYTFTRFLLISLGSAFVALGAALNVILLIVFALNYNQTLAILALLDMALCVIYVLVFGMDAVNVYLQINQSFYLWKAYLFPVFVASRTVQLAIPYLLTFATLERFTYLVGNQSTCLHFLGSTRAKLWLPMTIVAVCFLIRSPIIVVYDMVDYPNCTVVHRSFEVAPNDEFESKWYKIYDFYFIAIIQIFLPFLILIILNTVIVKKLWRSHTKSHKDSLAFQDSSVIAHAIGHAEKESAIILLDQPNTLMGQIVESRLRIEKRRIRNAIYTMAVICLTYLSCNSIHLLLTVFERFQPATLVASDDNRQASFFYTTVGDIGSFLSAFCSAIRLLIYYKCSEDVREQLRTCLCRQIAVL